jgi:hypothetical protein
VILAGNGGGNCKGIAAGAFKGGNLQFGNASCPGVAVEDPFLDALYVPAPGSRTLVMGDLAICRSAPVSRTDIMFNARGIGARCAIGAFEQAPLRRLAKVNATPCPPGQIGAPPDCRPASGGDAEVKPPPECPWGSSGKWPHCRSAGEEPRYPKRKGCKPGSWGWPACGYAGRSCGPRMVGIPPYCYPRYAVPSERAVRTWLRRAEWELRHRRY